MEPSMNTKSQTKHIPALLALYKPEGPSSNQFLNQVRNAIGIKKIGHAGTLDPLAKGVLVVGIRREGTKQLATAVAKEKEYIATVDLGLTSKTEDREGLDPNTPRRVPNPLPTTQEIQNVLPQFIGDIQQIPPTYSAVKIKGKEAYKRTRAGETLTMPPRQVTIKEIELIDYSWPLLTLRVVTGPGVYIRSLARDIGNSLGTGAYLKELERTRVGEWGTEKALTLDAFIERYGS